MSYYYRSYFGEIAGIAIGVIILKLIIISCIIYYRRRRAVRYSHMTVPATGRVTVMQTQSYPSQFQQSMTVSNPPQYNSSFPPYSAHYNPSFPPQVQNNYSVPSGAPPAYETVAANNDQNQFPTKI